MAAKPLPMFTIYENPSDFPGKFVVRRWLATNPPSADESPAAVSDSLLQARTHVPPGLTRFVRSPNDDPVIVEVWM